MEGRRNKGTQGQGRPIISKLADPAVLVGSALQNQQPFLYKQYNFYKIHEWFQYNLFIFHFSYSKNDVKIA